MTNPAQSVLHMRWVLKDVTDRSNTYTFGITVAHTDSDGVLASFPSGDLEQIADAGIDFVDNVATGAVQPLGYYLSHSCSRASNDGLITLTDVSNALGSHEVAGSPIYDAPFTLTGGASSLGWPEQCCQTISWRADYGTDPEFGTHTRPRADDRNRMFFGPLSSYVAAEGSEVPTRVQFSPQFLGDVTAAFIHLSGEILALDETDTGISWIAAWSRKNAAVKRAVEHSQQLYPTTQRRRNNVRPPLSWIGL